MGLNAEELKLRLGNRAKDIIATQLGFGNSKKVKCPAPGHQDKNPSMSWFEDGLMWKCHACDEKIDIFSYYTNYENLTFVEAIKKVSEMLGMNYEPVRTVKKKEVKPNIKTDELSEKALKYMEKRKINKKTLDHWKVLERNWNGNNVYVFQYFDENNELVYVSYRGIGRGAIKGGCEANTKPILWGMNNIDFDKPLVITEGQPDAMCVWQSGYKNVVSVPNGSKNLKWIDNCWDWLQNIKEFIIYADNDSPGMEMANNISERLDNCKIAYHMDFKDANELMYHKGEKEVLKLIREAINRKLKGLVDLSEVEYKSKINEIGQTIETGFIEYDSHIEDWKMQELTVIFGRNGEGKTTFISQIISHCLEKNIKTFLYSGEMSDQKIQDWLYKQLIGDRQDYFRKIDTKYKKKYEPKPNVVKAIKKWHEGKLFLYDRNEKETTDNMDKFFNTMEIACKRYGVKLFVIDNLMAILEENADSLFSDQANFVQRCKDFTIKNFCHIVLLAHPNKMKKELTGEQESNLEKTDISGSNNIPNKADNIIAVERIFDKENNVYDATISSLKDRETGQRKTMKFRFSKNSLRFYNENTQEKKVYGWTKLLAPEIREEFKVNDNGCPF